MTSTIVSYHISEPNEYLVITGGGIHDVRIVKKAFVPPWQKVCELPIAIDFAAADAAMPVLHRSRASPSRPSTSP